MDEKDKIIDLMNYDPIQTAEDFVGEKDTDKSISLGFGLHLMKNQMMKEITQKNGDVCMGTEVWIYRDVLLKNGFERVLAIPFEVPEWSDKTKMRTELQEFWWNPELSIFLVYDTSGNNVNGGTLYFNWEANSEEEMIEVYKCHLSGGWFDWRNNDCKIFIGQCDCREGIISIIKNLKSKGTFLKKWVERHFMWLCHHGDTKNPSYDYKKIFDEKFPMLPDYVREAMGNVTKRRQEKRI